MKYSEFSRHVQIILLIFQKKRSNNDKKYERYQQQ